MTWLKILKNNQILNYLKDYKSICWLYGVIYRHCKKLFSIFIILLHVLLFLILPEEVKQSLPCVCIRVHYVTHQYSTPKPIHPEQQRAE